MLKEYITLNIKRRRDNVIKKKKKNKNKNKKRYRLLATPRSVLSTTITMDLTFPQFTAITRSAIGSPNCSNCHELAITKFNELAQSTSRLDNYSPPRG